MAELLSDEWIADLAAAASTTTVDPALRLVVQQVVTDREGADLAYVVRLADGRVTVLAGTADDADITFTQDRDTALAIAGGRLSAQAAFMAGRLRVGGDLHEVLRRARDLGSLDHVFAAARTGAA